MSGADEPPRPDDTDLILVRHARPLLTSGTAAAQWVMDPAAVPDVHALANAVRAHVPTVGSVAGGCNVVASHEPKAIATARELAHVWGCGYSTSSDLEEHHRGPLPLVDDLTWRTTVARLFLHPATLVFGEETADEARERFTRGVDSVLVKRSGAAAPAVIVSHGTVITLYLAQANGLDHIELWDSLQLPEALLVRSRDRRLLGRVTPDGDLRLP